MKKTLAILLALVMLVGCISVGFSTYAADEELSLDNELTSISMGRLGRKTYAINVSEQGYFTLSVQSETPNWLIRFSIAGQSDSSRDYFTGSNDLKNGVYAKDFSMYLAPGQYEIEINNLSEASVFLFSTSFKATPYPVVVNMPVNKDVPFILCEWEGIDAYRIIVKKDYRLKFTLTHNFPVMCAIVNEKEKAVFKSKTYNATYQSPKTRTINVCLKKGTYYFGIFNLGSEDNHGSGIGTLKMEVKPFIPAPTGFKVITRKTTSQTVSYKAVKGVAGYQVQRSDGGAYWIESKTGTSLTCTFKGLYPGEAYKFRVRSYIVENGAKVYGPWSSTLNSPTKPNGSNISYISSYGGNISIMFDTRNEGVVDGYQFYFSNNSSFTSIAKKANVKPLHPLIGSQTYNQKGLVKGRTYYIKVRKYIVVNGVTYFGSWSGVKSVKCR